MPNSEQLKMIELVKALSTSVADIQGERNLKLFKRVSNDLQNVYSFHLSSPQSFTQVAYYLKSVYSSFNFAAGIINEVLKKKAIDATRIEKLDECLELIIGCCNEITKRLSKIK